MYIIANYDWFWRYPETFTNFKNVKNVFMSLSGKGNVIEFWDVYNQKRKLVYPKRKN
jgi:hypothetical protein